MTAEVHAWARERLVEALCIDHGHVDRPGSQACRTCNRRADAMLAVLPELLTDERVVGAVARTLNQPEQPLDLATISFGKLDALSMSSLADDVAYAACHGAAFIVAGAS